MVGHAGTDGDQNGDHRVDALVQEGHGGRAVNLKVINTVMV